MPKVCEFGAERCDWNDSLFWCVLVISVTSNRKMSILHLHVRADVTWPGELLDGGDVSYNTEVLLAGLEARDSVEGRLERLRAELSRDRDRDRNEIMLRCKMAEAQLQECRAENRRYEEKLRSALAETSAASDRGREEARRMYESMIKEVRDQEAAVRAEVEERLSAELRSARTELDGLHPLVQFDPGVANSLCCGGPCPSRTRCHVQVIA